MQLQRKEYGLQELEEKILRVAMVFSLEKRKFVEFAEVRLALKRAVESLCSIDFCNSPISSVRQKVNLQKLPF